MSFCKEGGKHLLVVGDGHDIDSNSQRICPKVS